MKATLKSTVLLLLLTLGSGTALAQKTVTEWAAMDDKKFARGHQYTTTLHHLRTSIQKGWLAADQVPTVKRVGLLTYMISQPTYKTSDKTSIYSHFLTSAGTETFLGKLFPPTFEAFSATLEKRQMSLLMPEQYADTPERKQLFEARTFENAGYMKAVAGIAAFFNSSREAAATGVVGKFTGMVPADIKVQRQIGQLSKEMGTDALLTIEQTIWYDGKTAWLGAVTVSLIMPNPTPQTDKTSYAPVGPLKGYVEGFVMGSVTVNHESIEIAEVKKTEVVWKSMDGLQTAYARIAENLMTYVNRQWQEATT